MTVTEPTDTVDAPDNTQGDEAETPASALVEEELLVEEISIDGMCGVY